MENHGGVKPHSCSHPYNFLTLLTEIGEEQRERRQWGAFMSPQLHVILRKKLTISSTPVILLKELAAAVSSRQPRSTRSTRGHCALISEER